MMLFSHVCSRSFITGAEKYVLMLASEAGRHYDCTLVVPEEGLLQTEAAQRGIRTLVHDIPLVMSMYDPGSDFTSRMEQRVKDFEHGGLVDLLHMHQPDVVVVNACVNPIPAIAAKTLGIPVIWCITEKISGQSYTRQTLEWIDRYSNWIVGMSDAALRPFRQAGFDAKLCLLPPTWRMEELHPEAWDSCRHSKRGEFGVEQHNRVIGYISSSLRPEKGLEHFVQMALSVCETAPDVHFLIVGNSSDASFAMHCQRLIDQSGHGFRFHRMPFEKRLELAYSAMDLVVIPSLVDEGFGLTALEGLVFGKGVIAYRSGGLEEILRTTGNTAWLVDKGDVAQLITKVNEWLQNDIHRRNACSSHQHTANTVFGLETYRHRLERLLTKCQEHASEADGKGQKRLLPPLLMNAVYKGKATSTVFLLENGVKRPFASEPAFYHFKFRGSDVNTVTDAVLHRFPTGAPISTESPFHHHRPSVMLAKGSGPAVYLLVGGKKFQFSTRAAMRQRGLDPDRIVQVPDAELKVLTEGEPLRQLHKEKRRRRRKRKKKLLRGKRSCKVIAARRCRKRTGLLKSKRCGKARLKCGGSCKSKPAGAGRKPKRAGSRVKSASKPCRSARKRRRAA
jgi:glycosyltransferase involved in cell wall biosynthesis